jgi:protein gp37
MGDKSKIEWTDATWNPVTGCSKISAGCKNCYAERMVERFPEVYPDGFGVQLRVERLDQPKRWRKPRRVFVCSMSDLFHDDVPDRFIFDILWTMRTLPRHTFQILTKRPERMRSLVRRKFRTNEPPQNVWFGVSVENQSAADERIPLLLDTRDAVRWLSCEPLLDPVDLGPYLDDLDWVVVGGESGPGARPMDLDWAREIRDQCIGAGVPFFFKQVGGRRKINGHFGGNLIDGRTWQEFPR